MTKKEVVSRLLKVSLRVNLTVFLGFRGGISFGGNDRFFWDKVRDDDIDEAKGAKEK